MITLTREELRRLIDTINSDASETEVASAISKLSVQYLKSDNREVGRIIAQAVLDSSKSDEFRVFSYLCLLDVSCRPNSEYPNMKTFRFPADADWAFVNKWIA